MYHEFRASKAFSAALNIFGNINIFIHLLFSIVYRETYCLEKGLGNATETLK